MSAPMPERTPYDGLRVASKEAGSDPLEVRGRVVRFRSVADVLSIVLVVAGLAVAVAAAWVAGGTVPGMATLAGALIALGVLLTL